MKRVLPYTDEEIAERVALRRACNDAIARTRKAAEERARREHFAAARARANPRFSDDVVRDAAKMTFRFTPDAETLAVEKALRDDAAEALPPEIKSEWYQVGDCGCVILRVYHVDSDAPEDRQIYAVERYCAAHDGLSLDDLYDAIHRERRLRSNAHRLLTELEPEAAPAFEWTGAGKTRGLTVTADWIADAHTEALGALARELGEEGKIVTARG